MKKILIVEDDIALREIYKIRLSAEGYVMVEAENGEDAVGKIIKERPDLVILDVMMPRISGFEMLELVRMTPEIADLKVIVMTALSAEEQRERAENLGALRYIVKSQVGIEDMVGIVKEVLGE